MKLAIYCSSNGYGGLELNLLRLGIWMKQRGHEVTMFSFNGSRLHSNSFEAGLNVVSIEKQSKSFDIKGSRKLAKAFSQKSIDVVITSLNKDLSLLSWTKFWSKNKFKYLYLQQMQVGVSKKDFVHSIRYSYIDAWIAPMQYLEQEVKEKTKIAHSKIHNVPLCIDLTNFVNNPWTKNTALGNFKLPHDKFYLGILGRLDDQKRQHLVIEALRGTNDNIHLIITGEETDPSRRYKKYLEKLIKEKDLEGRVHIFPFMKDTPLFYAAIDVFVMASLNETFGMVTIEAMASGKPVLGSNAGGTAEIVRDQTTGILFKPDDVLSLREGINHLFQNKEFSSTLGQNAKNEAIAKYAANVECERIEKIVEQI